MYNVKWAEPEKSERETERERKARVTAVGNVHECCDEQEKRDDNLNTPTHTKNEM